MDSVNQRKNFIYELEGKIKGLSSNQNTPKFTNVVKDEVKEFNFDKELERLKKTLTDIKDQECRFIKLLSKHSPNRSNLSIHQEANNKSELYLKPGVNDEFVLNPILYTKSRTIDNREPIKAHEASSIIEISSPVHTESAADYLDMTSRSQRYVDTNESSKRDVIAHYQRWSPSKDCKNNQTFSESDFNKRKSSLKKHGSQNSTEFSSITMPGARSR